MGWAASPSSAARPKVHCAIGSRSAVAQRFQSFGRSISWRARGADALEVALHLLAAAVAHAPLFLLAAVEGDDHVVLLAAAQRVVHQVAVRADPDAGGVPLQVGREVLAVDHRAVDHVARDARLVAHVLPAHRRLHAVGADQGDAAVLTALGVVDRDARSSCSTRCTCVEVATSMRSLACAPSSSEPCTSARWITAYGLPKRSRNASPVGMRPTSVFVERVVHHHLVGVDGACPGDLADAECVEGGEAVRPELDAGADLAELGRLLEHLDREAAPHQRECCGDAADAAAGDEHRKRGRWGCRHSCLRSFSLNSDYRRCRLLRQSAIHNRSNIKTA